MVSPLLRTSRARTTAFGDEGVRTCASRRRGCRRPRSLPRSGTAASPEHVRVVGPIEVAHEHCPAGDHHRRRTTVAYVPEIEDGPAGRFRAGLLAPPRVVPGANRDQDQPDNEGGGDGDEEEETEVGVVQQPERIEQYQDQEQRARTRGPRSCPNSQSAQINRSQVQSHSEQQEKRNRRNARSRRPSRRRIRMEARPRDASARYPASSSGLEGGGLDAENPSGSTATADAPSGLSEPGAEVEAGDRVRAWMWEVLLILLHANWENPSNWDAGQVQAVATTAPPDTWDVNIAPLYLWVATTDGNLAILEWWSAHRQSVRRSDQDIQRTAALRTYPAWPVDTVKLQWRLAGPRRFRPQPRVQQRHHRQPSTGKQDVHRGEPGTASATRSPAYTTPACSTSPARTQNESTACLALYLASRRSRQPERLLRGVAK